MNTYVKISLTLFAGIAMSFAFARLLEKGNTKFHLHKQSRMEELFVNNTRYDILFIGSSRTHTTINPAIIDSITGLHSYNAGVEGGQVEEFKLTLDGYLEKHPAPRLLVLSIDANSFDVGKKMFFPFQYFWALGNQQVKKAVASNKDFRFFIVDGFPFLRQIYYDDYTKSLALRGLLGQDELGYSGFTEYKGFATNGYTCADTTAVYPRYAVKIDQRGIKLLYDMADTCKKRGIQLILTYAPEYKRRLQQSFNNFGAFADTMRHIAASEEVEYFNEDDLAICNDPCLFANYGHVNTFGATEYSRILGQRIVDSILK